MKSTTTTTPRTTTRQPKIKTRVWKIVRAKNVNWWMTTSEEEDYDSYLHGHRADDYLPGTILRVKTITTLTEVMASTQGKHVAARAARGKKS